MRKKGVEMSMNVIIIAAIGLLILLILAFLIVNYVRNLNEGLKSCSVDYGGVCNSPCSGGVATTDDTDCTKNGQECCKVFG
ncbi:TPA: hypothetical protein HA235_05150 [Candidatus Woesearchaeota archaeon]|nr:hypothetical protein [Candidatus Woesearchaeota archaeon]HIH32068.1 hypothetical protein [Candidatus Woesearchaeota archaeon]HIH55122.1 hypothetical protein [Candidatus Woesearchaeota archaeon]HIJ01669.1 hypothetical protein [Candidatus Woesearchaeota archaeon]HIJ13337.1 hypothetical protein [Candidatus Woesearchaeota archaeon]